MDKKFRTLSIAYTRAQFSTACTFRGRRLVQGVKKVPAGLLGEHRYVRVVASVRNKVRQAPYIPSPPAGMRWQCGKLVPRHAGR